MTEKTPSRGQSGNAVWKWSGNSAIGLWLMCFYVLTTLLVILTLSAFQVQNKISNFQDGEKVYSVGEMVRLLDVWNRRSANIADATKRATLLQGHLTTIEEKHEGLQVTYDLAWSSYYESEAKVARLLSAAEGSLFDLKDKDPSYVIQQARPLVEKHRDDATIQASYVDTVNFFDETRRLDSQINNILKQRERAEYRFVKAQEILRDLHAGVSPTAGGNVATSLDALTKPPIQDLLNELIFFKEFLFGLTYLFTTMPAELLTLILTLAMGALGSVIYLTREFFNTQSQHPTSWYVFRPFLGMITALAIFVLAKAGVLIVADTSQASDFSGDLNPFFISFLAIVSGLLSEQATQRIQAAGVQFFRSETDAEAEQGKHRWAVKLKEEIAQQNRNTDEIRHFVEVDEDQLEDWMEERKSVPGQVQTVIAAWLNKPKRELFTDLPPTERPATPR